MVCIQMIQFFINGSTLTCVPEKVILCQGRRCRRRRRHRRLVQSLDQEVPLEEGMVTHSSILA